MKSISLRKIFLLILMFGFLATTSYSQSKKTFTLVVDAGHGGHDSGTTGNNKYKKYEKDVALKIAIKFGKLVELSMPDVKVVYTRDTDVFIKLIDRPKIANDNNADLFMSIHCNANNNKSVNGSETYVLGTHKNDDNFNVAKKENSVIYLEDDYSVNYEGFDPNSMASIVGLTLGQEQYLENSLLLASLVQKNFKKNTALRSRGSNGVKQAGFWVLARNSMPSILVEAGFLSNDKDAKYLMSEKGTYQVANALFLGFQEYKKFWDEQSGMSYVNPTEQKNYNPADLAAIEQALLEKGNSAVDDNSPKVEQSIKVVVTPKVIETPKVEEVPEIVETRTVAETSKVVETIAVEETPKVEETTKVEENKKPKSEPITEKVEAKSIVAMMIDPKSSENKPAELEVITPQIEEVKKEAPENVDRIEYAIQLFSLKNRISSKHKSFKGLTKVSYYKDGSTYKYIYNRYPNYEEVLSSQVIVKKKGFKGSFIVAFKNGKRIPLSRALKEDKSR